MSVYLNASHGSIDPAECEMYHKLKVCAVTLICSSLAVCVALKKNMQDHIHRPELSDTLLKYVDEPFSA